MKNKQYTDGADWWGLLCKPNTDEGKWHPVMNPRFVFDTKEKALQQANEWMINGKGYLYRPIEFVMNVVWEIE